MLGICAGRRFCLCAPPQHFYPPPAVYPATHHCPRTARTAPVRARVEVQEYCLHAHARFSPARHPLPCCQRHPGHRPARHSRCKCVDLGDACRRLQHALRRDARAGLRPDSRPQQYYWPSRLGRQIPGPAFGNCRIWHLVWRPRCMRTEHAALCSVLHGCRSPIRRPMWVDPVPRILGMRECVVQCKRGI